MKRAWYMIFGIGCIGFLVAHHDVDKTQEQMKQTSADEQAQAQKEKNDREVQAVLYHFGNIVGNFINIVQRPNDKDHVGNQVGGMLSNIVNIAMHVIKKSMLTEVDKQELVAYFDNLDEATKEQLAEVVIASIKRSHLCIDDEEEHSDEDLN